MKMRALGFAVLFTSCGIGLTPSNNANARISPQDQISTLAKIPELMRSYDVAGLAVTAVAGDEVVFSGGFGVTADGETYTSSSSCGLFSATKTIASLTYAGLARDGSIDLNAPLGEYLSTAPEAWQSIPFYRLLNHTSGITMVVNKDGFGALVSNPASSNRDVYQMVSEAPLDYQPGEYSRYRQSGYAIAEMVMEERLGESFDVLAARYVTGPAGMANTQHASARLDSEPAFLMSAGGFQTTADDMAKMFLNINNSVILTPGDWKAMLTDERYRFDDYSLGALIEERDGVLTVGHSGGGARANIRYAPDAKIGVMICTDERQNGGLAIQLARMLVHEIAFGEEPALPMMVALSGYRDMSAARVVAAYHSAAAEGDRYDLSGAEPLLNAIGYFYVAEERLDDAIEVFTLNSEAFPQSPNVHDSLGEALLMNGDREGALEQYRQVLTLAPDNENAAQMVARILEMND